MGGTAEFADSTEVVAVEDCLSTTLDGESVILHTGKGKYYGFNQVGTDIWEWLQEPKTVQELSERIVTEYDVSPNRSRSDLEALLGKLLTKDLIRIVDQ